MGTKTDEKHSQEKARHEKHFDTAPTEKKLEELYKLIDGIEIAMMTTRLSSGMLVSRPMATQDRLQGTDLWFVTSDETAKVHEIEDEAQINLAYYKNYEFVSVSGKAKLTRDKSRIRELYKPDWKAWMGDEGGDRDGGPNDPRIVLIEVDCQTVTYLKRTKPQAVVLFDMVKGLVTGERAEAGVMRELSKSELKRGEGRSH